MDISLALEEEALVLALFGQSISEKNGISAPKEVQARLLYRLSDYLNQHRNSPYDCVIRRISYPPRRAEGVSGRRPVSRGNWFPLEGRKGRSPHVPQNMFAP